MSSKRPLADVPERDLREEIRRRETARLAGVCDYCEKPPTEPPCAHPERHVASGRPKTREEFLRLLVWLRDRPDVLSDLAAELRMPLPKCEGPNDCTGLVLWPTPSQTQYEWDGTGKDPNADKMLCPLCSAEYTENMDDQWAEYYRGLL